MKITKCSISHTNSFAKLQDYQARRQNTFYMRHQKHCSINVVSTPSIYLNLLEMNQQFIQKFYQIAIFIHQYHLPIVAENSSIITKSALYI